MGCCPIKNNKVNIYLTVLCGIFISCSGSKNRTSANKHPFAARLSFVGIAVQEKGYHIWCTSPIEGNDGKIHLFVARWPKEYNVDPGWRSHSEIAHYIGERPEGPFVFSDIVLQGTGVDTWDKYAPHNPTIHKVGNTFVLFYIANNNPSQPPHPSNQKIGMLFSKSLYGPWLKAGSDGLIFQASADSTFWNFKASNGVNNPAFYQHPNGKYYLYFKSTGGKMGVAIADSIKGPYQMMPTSVTSNKAAIEDGYAFSYKKEIALLTTDNHGIIEKGGGILWTSKEGKLFDTYEQGFRPIENYVTFDKTKSQRLYGSAIAKFERPQLLIQKGKPTYLYVTSGTNIYGGDCTVSYVLKVHD